MAGSLDSYSYVQEFLRFLPTARIRGINGSGLAYFIPRSEVRDWFATHGETFRKIIAVAAGEEEHIHLDDVQKRYTTVLAILLSIGYANHLKNFVGHDELEDERLPFYTKPLNFPITTNSPDEFWSKFEEEQWKFCTRPFEVLNDAHLHPKRILPILEKKQIGRYNPPCRIQKVVLRADYDKLRTIPDITGNHTYVFKEFHGRHAQKAWSQERIAFDYVANGQDQWPIVKFYGSFRIGDIYTIILEYANKDSLDRYMTTTDIPNTISDVYHLWEKQLGLIDALYRIHTIPTASLPYPTESKKASILRGFHQDIKPHNILVFGTRPGSEHNVEFRLSDLGLSHFHSLGENGQEVAPITSRGTKQYGAPELFSFDHAVGRTPIAATSRVDIWSLGCVLSEFAVWLILGKTAVAQYRFEREAITSQKGSDIGCFHDSVHVLGCIEEWHDKVINHKSDNDHMTDSVLRSMVSRMLSSRPEDRPTANWLLAKSKHILNDAKELALKEPASTGNILLDEYLVMEPDQSDGDDAREIQSDVGLSESRSSTQRADSLVRELETLSRTTSELNGSSESGYSTRESPLSPAPLFVRGAAHAQSQPGNTSQADRLVGTQLETVRAYRNSGLPELATPTSGETPVVQQQSRPRASTTSKPSWTIQEGLAWLTMRKARKTIQGIPDNGYLKRLQGRDFIFIIDDAETMAPHWNEVKKVVKLLGWLLKDSDDDGIELCFTGEPSTPYRAPKQKSSRLQDPLGQRKAKAMRSTTDIKWRLDTLLHGYLVKLERHRNMRSATWQSIISRRTDDWNIKPLMLYVLTDGIWEDGSDPAAVIKEAAERLQWLGKPSDQVGIQFIRFGDDQESVQKLQRLDSGLNASRDIVDTEPVSGNVFKMLLGPLFRMWDGD